MKPYIIIIALISISCLTFGQDNKKAPDTASKKNMTKLLENIFAVEVPGDAYTFSIKSNTLTCLTGEEGFTWRVFLPPGSYEILFTTKDCTEQQAASIVERARGGYAGQIEGFKDYYPQGMDFPPFDKAVNSMVSLLKRRKLDSSKNYLLLKAGIIKQK